MELHTKQLQIGVNSAVAAELWAPSEMHTGALLMVISKKYF